MTKKTNYGATPKEWDKILKFAPVRDILPVVSSPEAKISSNSTMKQTGKTPSQYNGQGYVVGLPKWTERETTEGDIKQWRKHSDYGISIQTRFFRAFDIDVEDRKKAKAIIEFIEDVLMASLPLRYREDSGKCLLAFYMNGEIGKRTLKVDGGMIEFLANGQQFIAAGTHQKGARYLWEIPEGDVLQISHKEFESCWRVLEKEFGTADSTKQHTLRKQRIEGETVKQDTVVDFLEENGLVLAYGSEGQAHITCPFEDEHTTESAVSATSYFSRGTRGYERGHFKCMHAHCEHRHDDEFLHKLGFYKFDDLTEQELAELLLPRWERDKAGRPRATLNNVVEALAREDVMGSKVRFDIFQGQTVIHNNDKKGWCRVDDSDFVAMRRHLQKIYGFHRINRDLMRDAAILIARDHQIDTCVDWVNSKEWDGIPRVERFVADYLGGADTTYTRAVSLYMWTALAGRVLVPGVKADMVPVLRGPQGFRKSTAIAAMAPTVDQFRELSFGDSDADNARRIKGATVIELSELRGLSTKALEGIKAFITRTRDEWIQKYQEYLSTYARRCVFFATTNEMEFLADSTGNRRWLPFEVERHCDTDAIARDRKQLWAEGVVLFKKEGILFEEAERLAVKEHEKFMLEDPWMEAIAAWMHEEDDVTGIRPIDNEYIISNRIENEVLGLDIRKIGNFDKKRLSNIMRTLGYERGRVRIKKKQHRVWVKKDTPHLC